MMDDLKKKKAIENYWLRKLRGDLPKISLPFLNEKGVSEETKKAQTRVKVPEPITARLKEISDGVDLALFILIFSALNIVIHKYTGLEDLVIGTVTLKKENVKDKIILSRNRVSGEMIFIEIINQVQQGVLEDFNHSDYSFGVVYHKLLTGKGLDHPDVFNVACIYDKLQNKSNILEQFGLVLVLKEFKNELSLEAEYDSNRCDGEMIRKFCRNLIYIFDNISGKIDQEIARISIVSAWEKQELFDFNRRHLQVEYPQHKTIHELFEQQVEKTPHHIAVVGQSAECKAQSRTRCARYAGRCALTYRELNKRSNRLARVLREKGVGPGTIVGVLMERSIETVQGMLGILKAGAAYLPIDCDLPTGRVTAMLDDSSAAFLLTQNSIGDKHAFTGLQGLGKSQLKSHINLSPPASPILHFDELPFVDRSLIDCEKYNRYIGQSIVKNRILIQASRGCPYNCAYCYRIWPRQQVARSGENIFKEILLYYHLGIRKFDIFMLNIKEGKRLFELIVENNLEDIELYFPNGFRGDLLTREYIDLMVKAGTVNFALALETASPRLQKLIHKNLNLEKFKEIIEYVCQEYPHVILELFTMHGIPTETQPEALMTLDFIKSLKWVHFPYVNVLKIYQHTHMEKLALENGISRESILRSENMAWHEWSDTLPFDKNFTSRYQVEFLSEYLLSKERLLQVLPYQGKILTEDEFVQKYDSYFPGDIKSFADFLKFTGLGEDELRGLRFRDTQEDEAVLHNLNERIAAVFPAKQPSKNAFRVLLLDLSQFFSHTSDMLYDVVDPPLGLMYILTYLKAQLGDKINGRILKPRIDFDSYEELKAVLEEFKPQVIGIRTLSYYKDFFHRTTAAIRQWGVDVPIITGGPYATVDYETILQDRNIDLAVLGEGEITFCELIEKIMANDRKLPGDEVLEKIAGIAFVPKTKGAANGLKDFAREILFMDQLKGALATGVGKSAENLENINRSSDPAYIIFTSGSTGKPKGVIVEHKNAVNVLNWFGRTYHLQKDTHVVQLTNYAFDPSVEQIFSTLLHGSTLYTAGKELIADKDQFNRFVEENQIHIINFVPGTLGELLGGEKKLGSLQAVISGGEKLEESVKNRLLEKGYRLYNQYGPTETTIDALMARCTKNKVNLGHPISNVSCYILDKNNNLVPIGAAGELNIAGAGVTRGYLNRPELTAERFVLAHSSWLTADRTVKEETADFPMSYQLSAISYIYKTGDLARWLPEGNIEFLGRRDHQVKIRGHRIELGEIETILQKHDKIKEAVVAVQGNIQKNVHLCAYIVPHPGHSSRVTDSELRDFLSLELAEYMVPSHFVTLEAFPLLPSGKVNSESLPHPGETGSENEVEYAAPKNEIEKKLVEVWEHVLGRNLIGTNENFFAIGGDSITSIQIVSRMNEAGYKVEMSDIFKYPTIIQLAPRVRELRQHKPPDQSLVTGIVPLTPVQEEFFRKNKIEPHHFNHAVMFHSTGGFDEEATRAVFLKIQEHHDALRMTFREKDEEIIQTNHGLEYPFSLQIYDFRGQKEAAGVLEIKANEIQASIDLAKGPLMKLGLFHTDDGDRLLIVIHHLVIDGVSWRILFNDIESLFRQYKKGEPLVLPAKTDSFKLWAEKLSGYANSPLLLKEKEYWTHLESTGIPGIKKDFQCEYNYIKDSDTLFFRLTKGKTEKLLTRVNQAFGTEINDILLTALGLGIRETYGLHQVLTALEGHGREEIIRDANTHRTVGWFTSVYPILPDVSFASDLSRQIKEIKESLRRIPNKGIGYGILKYLTADEYKTGIDFKLNPQISFNYLGQFDPDVEQMSFAMAKESTGNQRSMKAQREYQLDVTGIITNQQLVISIIYNKKQYKPENMKKLLQNYEAALCRIISFCSALKESEPTPADFTYKKLSIEAVEAITARSEGEIEDIYTLSPMQEGMLFQALFDTSSFAYFEQMSYRLHGKLDETVVEKSLNELFKRYDILRTFFLHKGLERPVQVILKHRQVDFYYKDLAGIISREEKERFITEFKEKDRQRSFDLGKDVLMRVAVIKLADEEYEFTWSHHHILMDGWCTGILIPEFFKIYNSYLEKRPYRLPAVTPYRIYIEWLEEQNEEESKNYWKNYLDGYEGTEVVPTFGSTGSIGAIKKGVNFKAYKNELVFMALEKEKTTALNDLAAANQVTLNTILQTVWGIILGMYNGKQDVVFGGVVSGRPSEIPGVESMVGLFINTIPVRIKYEDKPTFTQLLGNVQKEAIENERYHYYPLAKIQTQTPQKQNLLNHIVALQNFPAAREIKQAMDKNKNEKNSAGAALKLSDFEAFEQIHYDLGVVFVPGDQLEIRLNYNAHVYERNLIERIANHFILVFNQVLNNRNAEWFIDELTLISEEEKNQVLYDFNNTEAEYPADKTLHQLFAGQVARTPDHTALKGQITSKKMTGAGDRHISITYRELNEKSNQLAHLLKEKGVQPDTIVGIMVEPSIEMIVGLLGILKAGGAYLPIDPGYPAERKRYMMADSRAEILLTAKEIASAPKAFNNGPKGTAFHLHLQPAPATSLAYVIYTSGTTGSPKGVPVGHRNAVNTLSCRKEAYKMNPKDISLQLFSYSFDGFVTSFFTPIISGAKVVLMTREEIKDIKMIKQAIVRNGITHFISVPTLYQQIIDNMSTEELAPLKVVTLAGDQLSVNIIDTTGDKNKNLEIAHEYGVTEAAVMSTLYRHQEKDRKVKIGNPVWNTRIYMIDKQYRVQGVGIPGELCIAGAGVARGYLNNPELTAEKFLSVSNKYYRSYRSYMTYISKKIYKTGDLARWLPDGNIEFLGRIDHQVKIRGFRIESGEIEYQLLQHNGIKETVVLANEEKNGGKYLCAYIVPVEPDALNVSELRKYLMKKLPEYMVPGHFVNIEKIPLTANGKVDRKAIERYGTKLGTGVEYAAPRNKMEKIIADTWKKVLKLEKVSIHDNFFDLGGNSLSIIRINNQLNEVLENELSIVAMFEYPTIESLSVYLTQAGTRESSIEKEIEQFDELNDEAFGMMEQTLGIIGRSKNE